MSDARNPDAAAVINLVKAARFAVSHLQKMTLCNNLLRQTHAILMEGKNGQKKSPGEFRHTQNLIGTQGSTLSNAQHIPPSPDDMTDAMSGLEKYINSDDKTDVLIRAALIHYQFETIHPSLMATDASDVC